MPLKKTLRETSSNPEIRQGRVLPVSKRQIFSSGILAGRHNFPPWLEDNLPKRPKTCLCKKNSQQRSGGIIRRVTLPIWTCCFQSKNVGLQLHFSPPRQLMPLSALHGGRRGGGRGQRRQQREKNLFFQSRSSHTQGILPAYLCCWNYTEVIEPVISHV